MWDLRKFSFKQAMTADPKILDAALKRGLNIFEVDRWGETLLHQAVIDDHQESLQLLLNVCKDITIKNSYGFTCTQLAQYLHRQKLMECLLSRQPALLEVWNDKEAPVVYSEKEFKVHMGFEYVPHLTFKSVHFLRQITKRVQRYPLDNKIAMERRWLGALYKPHIESGYIPKVRVQFIDKQIGYGLFAGQEFKPGDFIGEYTGEVKKNLFLNGFSNEYVGEYALGGKDPVRFVIDARYKGNHTRFINHSDQPNASAITVISGGLLHVILRSEALISKGEELTFDYGPDYWKRRKKRRKP